jgi:hypothetical protein
MTRTIIRLTSSIGLALCLGLAFTPVGCGGSQEMGGMESSHRAGEGPQAPEATISELTDCANKGAARLKETSYAFQFDVEVTESGHAGRVKVRDSYPGDSGIESCMARALEGMTSPVPVMRLISQQAVSPQSRGVMGIALPIAAGVSLAPIFITAFGVTIIVGIGLSLSKEAVEAINRQRKAQKDCMNWLVECLNTRKQPEWNRDTYGSHKDCQSCFGHCIKHNGKWHEAACPRPN